MNNTGILRTSDARDLVLRVSDVGYSNLSSSVGVARELRFAEREEILLCYLASSVPLFGTSERLEEIGVSKSAQTAQQRRALALLLTW